MISPLPLQKIHLEYAPLIYNPTQQFPLTNLPTYHSKFNWSGSDYVLEHQSVHLSSGVYHLI